MYLNANGTIIDNKLTKKTMKAPRMAKGTKKVVVVKKPAVKLPVKKK